MPTAVESLITDAHRKQYRDEGFFLLHRVIPPDLLEMLRDECTELIGEVDAEMNAKGTDVVGLNHRGKRYFVGLKTAQRPRLRQFLFHELMADICRATLGPEAYLFYDQFVVKCAEQGIKFSWHQDSGYLAEHIGWHQPYVTCWCALDDMSEANGTVHVLPYAKAGTKEIIVHKIDPATNDRIGYHGEDPGVTATIPAGSIAVFSSCCFHSSGANTTPRPRRALVAQYSCERVLNKDGQKPWALAYPFLKNNQIISDPNATDWTIR